MFIIYYYSELYGILAMRSKTHQVAHFDFRQEDVEKTTKLLQLLTAAKTLDNASVKA